MRDAFLAPFEIKLSGDASSGEFEGYASVFGNQDSHGDVIKPGAFTDSLAERKAAGRSIPMHVMHGFLGGDGIPVGVWKSVAEDSKGLLVHGKISGATNTEGGKLLYEKVKDGALPGMSIGYKVKPNGATYGKEAGEPKRTLKALHIREISLVDDPSNADALVSGVKAAFAGADADKAAAAVAQAIRMHDQVMKGYSYSGSSKDQALMMDHLRDAHEALTGARAPDGIEGWTKSVSREDFEAGLKSAYGMAPDLAHFFAGLAYKAAPAPVGAPDASTVTDLGKLLTGFRMPAFG